MLFEKFLKEIKLFKNQSKRNDMFSFSNSSIKKYISVFKISFAQEFAYRINFIMWRLRNVLQIFLVYFLWDTVFANQNRIIFGYTREKILTYVFLTIFVKAFVFSSRTVDVSGEIAQGQLSNYLLRPISYFKYWWTRDMSSKFLNISFAIVEFALLVLFLKPDIFIQTNILNLLLFVAAILIAIFFYFALLFIISAIPFWMPEAAWGGNFILIVILEALSGTVFPVDILPVNIQNILFLTPFPYLVFFPVQIYLGNLTPQFIARGFLISILWCFILYYLMRWVWRKGLLVYQSFGR